MRTATRDTRTEAESVRRLARMILDNEQEYSQQERERVRAALEDEPHTLPHLLRELHAGQEQRQRAA